MDAWTWHTVGAASARDFGSKQALWAYGKMDFTNEHEYQPGVDKFMILASDGVWELYVSRSCSRLLSYFLMCNSDRHRVMFVSFSLESQRVIDYMAKWKDNPQKMAQEIVKLSANMWKQEEEGVRDDITAVVICFKD